ncbi:hypothetical protein [Streptomyces sp. NPDC051135]|uniref:hypothetical protein n=1 Tax=unclassified Streptomyces TaxID=2593676 RepID=UPI00341A92CE
MNGPARDGDPDANSLRAVVAGGTRLPAVAGGTRFLAVAGGTRFPLRPPAVVLIGAGAGPT